MKKLTYVLGPVFLATAVTALTWYGSRLLMPQAEAYTVPVTFSDGAVLTAAQLNSVNDTAANAFNGHNHAGTDGEASTLAFTAMSTTSLTFPSAFTLDATDKGTIFGSGTGTSTVDAARQVLVNTNTGDASIRLQVGNSSSTAWDMTVDNSDSDEFKLLFNGTAAARLQTDGDLEVVKGVSTNEHGDFIAWQTYTGTTCNPNPCDTNVDTDAPGSAAPFIFTCMVEDSSASGIWRNCASYSTCRVQYNESANDLEIEINSSSFDNEPYKCIVFYAP